MSILSRGLLNNSANLRLPTPGQPCLLCGASSRDGAWCAACTAALPGLDTPHCPLCALPTPGGTCCGRCLKRAPHFDRTVSAFAYVFPLDRLVQAFKFQGQLLLAAPLADRLAQRVRILPDCIVPMPLHPVRLCERSFNQSLELARRIGQRLGRPVLAHACRRIRDTPAQSTLDWRERRRNMRKAFACTQDMSDKHVAIVDDVMTSGASLNELAKTLRRAGAEEISAWVVARTLPP